MDRIKHRDQLFDELAYEGDDDFSVYGDSPEDDGCLQDPIYDDESNEDRDDEFNTPIWDLYEDDNDIYGKIFDISQDCDFYDRIMIFHQHQDYDEDTPIVSDEQIDILDSVNWIDVTLEGVVKPDDKLNGSDVIDFADN